jgi:hypothetical protein
MLEVRLKFHASPNRYTHWPGILTHFHYHGVWHAARASPRLPTHTLTHSRTRGTAVQPELRPYLNAVAALMCWHDAARTPDRQTDRQNTTRSAEPLNDAHASRRQVHGARLPRGHMPVIREMTFSHSGTIRRRATRSDEHHTY